MFKLTLGVVCAAALGAAQIAGAAEVKVLTAGAMQNVVLDVIPEFERGTGHRVTVVYDTVGALSNRIQAGETFDVAVLTPAAIDDLTTKGKIAAGSRANLAQVGIGVMVKEGAAAPNIANVDSLKRALLAARSVGYIDPAAGGSSGIYFNALIDRLGIGPEIRAKAKLKQGGAVADLVVSGDAEIGIHQISEIVGYKGVTLIGPFPQEVQNITVYGAGLGSAARDGAAARAFISAMGAPQAAEHYRRRGLEPAR